MSILKEILHKTSAGEPAAVNWSHLRTHFPGETDRQRWVGLWQWTRDMQLFYAAHDLTIAPSGEIASGNLVFWVDIP